MRPAMLVVLASLCAIPLSLAGAQRNCRTGIPCGNTCISANRTCRVGTIPSAPTGAPTTQPVPGAPPPVPAAGLPQGAPESPTSAPTSAALIVPGVPGYVALDSTELIEVQAARLRALERRFGGDSRQSRGDANTPRPDSTGRDGSPRANAADQRDTSLPWVGSNRGKVYYRNGCRAGSELSPANRIYFASEEAAQAAGYRRSTSSGC